MEKKYERLKEIVEKELACSAHDMEHVMRVYKLCLQLAKYEPGVDLDVLKTAALLHDIARVKEDEDSSGNTDHAIIGAELAEKILKQMGYSHEKIEQIRHCIISHRLRSTTRPETKEAKILSDADKLDFSGAVGIARSWIFAGQTGQKFYSDIPINEYIKDNLVGEAKNGRIKDVLKHTPNLEFEIKVKGMPSRLYTKKAKEVIKERLGFMNEFYKRLKREINGEL